MHIEDQLKEIKESLKRIESRLDELSNDESKSSFTDICLSLPDHLRSTYMALHNNGPSDATDISKVTNKARAVESSYLNQLLRMGLITKSRSWHKAIFKLKA